MKPNIANSSAASKRVAARCWMPASTISAMMLMTMVSTASTRSMSANAQQPPQVEQQRERGGGEAELQGVFDHGKIS